MNRAVEAREILANPLFQEITEIVRKSFYEEWINANHVAEREKVFLKVETLEGIMNEITAITLETSDGK